MFKRILRLLLTFVLMVVLLGFGTAGAPDGGLDETFTEEVREILIKQDLANGIYRLFTSKIEDDEYLRSVYGGAYIDRSTTELCIFAKDIDYVSSVVNSISPSSNVYYLIARYSYDELKNIVDSLVDSCIMLGITVLGVDEVTNCVYVHTDSENNLAVIIEWFEMHNIAPDQYRLEVSEPFRAFSTEVKGGKSFWSQPNGTSGTFGMGAKKGAAHGFVTHGHNLSVNEEIYTIINGSITKIGTVKNKQFNGTVDAVFVEFTNNVTPNRALYYGGVQTGINCTWGGLYGMAVNTYLRMQGTATGGTIWGYVTDCSGTCSYDDAGVVKTFTDFIITDIGAQDGDSGGPLLFSEYNGSAGATTRAIGIVGGGSGSLTGFCKSSNIFTAFGLSDTY